MRPQQVVQGCLIALTVIGAFVMVYAVVGKTVQDLALHDRIITLVPEIREKGLDRQVLDALREDDGPSVAPRILLGVLGAAVCGIALLGMLAADRIKNAEPSPPAYPEGRQDAPSGSAKA